MGTNKPTFAQSMTFAVLNGVFWGVLVRHVRLGVGP